MSAAQWHENNNEACRSDATPAQVTEEHIYTTAKVGKAYVAGEDAHAAQLIADSEAKACAQLRAEVDAQCLLNAKGSEREAVLLGRVDRMAKECLNLRADLDAIKAIRNEETARAERAEAEVADLKANNRFHRGHSAGYAEAKADCEAELAAERARLDWLLSRMGGNVLPANKCVAWTVDVYHYGNRFPSRAAIDAAIKEETK